MKIYRNSDSIKKRKPSGTEVTYNLFDEYEININLLPPNTFQDWHYHQKKEEVILVTEGELSVEWKDGNGRVQSQKLLTDDLVRVEGSYHRFLNSSDHMTKFICFKLVLTGESKRDILKGDKYSS